MAISSSRLTFLAGLLGTKTLTGGATSIEDVKAECLSFMIAASDTTGGLVSPLMACLIEHSHVYEKLMAEIDEFERQGKLSSPMVTFDETADMPFFSACVKETLRLFPPAPIILPRYVGKGGLSLGNALETWLPEGTEIAANPWITNRDTGNIWNRFNKVSMG